MKSLIKKLLLIGIGIVINHAIIGQDILGSWNGELEIPGTVLPLVFNISEIGDQLKTTLDSPAQGAKDIPTTSTTYIDGVLKINIAAIGASYEGGLKGDTLAGIFSQSGMNFELKMTRGTVAGPNRPQEPKEPFPYKVEEVTFTNTKAGDIKLAGTLTLPLGLSNPPVAVLITGSGPQDRNEMLLGHKPFLVLADHLTRNGIAVLRYDDRGVGESKGTFANATSFDFASDVEAAVAYLKSRMDVVDVSKIGLVGHSEGGLIAPIVASKDKDIAFNVLLAGPGVTGSEILVTQTRRSLELDGNLTEDEIEFNEKLSIKVFDIISTSSEDDIKENIRTLLVDSRDMASDRMKEELTDDKITQQINQVSSPWMISFIKFDPKGYLEKVKSPVLAINGEKDFQVLPGINLTGIEKALKNAGNKDYTIKELKSMNHLFQTCETGAMSEYTQIEETFSPIALKIVSDWINDRF